jgi:hypothetical protein
MPSQCFQTILERKYVPSYHGDLQFKPPNHLRPKYAAFPNCKCVSVSYLEFQLPLPHSGPLYELLPFSSVPMQPMIKYILARTRCAMLFGRKVTVLCAGNEFALSMAGRDVRSSSLVLQFRQMILTAVILVGARGYQNNHPHITI